jgi:hypothetical protein
MTVFKFTHTTNISNKYIDNYKRELTQMQDRGFILHTMAMAEFQKEYAERERRYPQRLW